MSIFNLFTKKPSFDEGLSMAKNTENSVLLDVRTKDEYQRGHVPGSKNIPLANIQSIKISKDKHLFVYCLSGARSSQACNYLTSKGYKVTNIGGIVSYRGEME